MSKLEQTQSDGARDRDFSKNNHSIFLAFVGFGTFLCALNFCFSSWVGETYPNNTPFLHPEDRYMDFFNVNYIIDRLDPYLGHASNYPPFALLLAKGFGFFYDTSLLPLEARKAGVAVIPLLFIFILFMAGVSIYVAAKMKTFTRLEQIATVALVGLSYPVMFMFDRGNYLALAVCSLALFSLNYRRPGLLPAALLAIAISLKIYLGLFVVLFLADRRYRDFVMTVFFVALFNLLPLLLFEGAPLENIRILVTQILGYSKGGDSLGISVSFQNSIVAPIRILRNLYWHFPGKIQIAFYLSSTVLGLIYMVKFLRDKTAFEYRFLVVTIFMILFQPMSPDYNLVFLCIPLIDLMGLGKVEHWFETFLLSLLMIFKGYYLLYYSGQHYYATIQCLINPILLTTLFFSIVWRRRHLFVRTSEDKEELSVS